MLKFFIVIGLLLLVIGGLSYIPMQIHSSFGFPGLQARMLRLKDLFKKKYSKR